ncbi:MAG: bifunctional phosphopantothenoylcysteine decarboxylase/phosphopantothenate--cysteine ligase CoaBC [Anaerolineales bacterium]|nr:bifunctional phosphopantothenoylcysteine decarboxylase/phosphopantothenate--cysteine ligase CoaBC [Anaerolineales bacterium]
MITVLKQKRIILAVTGSIACYKSLDLASKLTQAGALVDVVMSSAAQQFVTALAFRSVTGRPVYTDMWDEREHVQHVNLGETADLLVVAPATANTMAKMAQGLADNLVTLTAISVRCPILVAPAMDGGMYEHPATQANVNILRERGVRFVGPAEGRMASGLIGKGRMVEPEELLGQIRIALGSNNMLAGKHVVVTAGPTREKIDPVRFITNRSTGKQGVALAQAALDAGANVTLILGPVEVAPPYGAQVVHVLSTQEMHDATVAAVEKADVLLMAAAVSDFRPSAAADQKLKKTQAQEWGMAIGLERTLDILEAVKQQRDETGYPQVVLGFAAETQNAFDYGRDKLRRKGLDFIAINDVTAKGAGFGVDTNRVTLLNQKGELARFPLQSKAEVAEQIVRYVAQAFLS